MSHDDATALTLALAGEAGYESFEEHDDGSVSAYIQQQLWSEDLISQLQSTLLMMGIETECNTKEAEYRDWNAEWESQGYEPIMVGGCCIHDTQHLAPADAQLDVTIEARQAFGTGTHETTQMLVGQLMSMDLQGKTILDCGCGTGILGIVAAMRGASYVVGYDIDEWSTDNCRHNAMLNGVSDRLDILLGDSSVIPDQKFDIVLANINRNILLADLPRFAAAMQPHSTLLLSGFYPSDAPMLCDTAAKLSLRCTNQLQNGDWCALVLGGQG